MAETLNRMLQGSPAAWTGLGRPQQLLLGALGLLLPVVLFFGSQWVTDGQYVPLFASLTAEDAGAIVNQLKAAKTPYRVGGGGDQILVPADKVSELRLRMAVQGLPLGGGVGFEVFDKPALGVSDFTQRLNYQRALGGELARTIGQLREVSRARVHLALPQPSLFADRERPASASVFLKLLPGAQLGREQIRGIVHLVASSVEGLAAERVTVIDTSGRVLSVGGDAQANPLSPRRLELKASVEEGVERRVQTLLDAALGAGQAVTRVSAQINFDQVERTEEKYDPQGVARQKTKSVESSKGRSTTPGATPAPEAEKTAATPAASKESVSQNEGNRESESVTYELSRTVAKTLTAPGEIQRLSVAVLLNVQTKVTVGPDKKEVRTPQPRSPEELEKIRKVVMGAVGFNETRKDEVSVTELPFDTTALERERALLEQPLPPAPARPLVSMPIVVGAAVAVVLVVAILFFLLRGRSRQRARAAVALTIEEDAAIAGAGETAPRPRKQAGGMPRGGSGGLVAEELLEAGRRHDDIRQKAFTLASAEPDETAQLLRAWLVKKKSLASVKAGTDGS